MISFLKGCSISDSVINEITKVNSGANLYNLDCNRDEVIKIINYLNELGIKCIEQLLIYRIDIFFESLDVLKKRFAKYEVNSLVQSLNNDYTIIDEI